MNDFKHLFSRRFWITILAMAFQLLPLFHASPEAERSITAIMVIAVVALVGFNVEDWLYARKIFGQNNPVTDALENNKPPAVPAVSIAFLIAAFGSVQLIMRM
jgi:hypothetical protein